MRFENLEGAEGSGVYIPIGQAIGSQETILEVFDSIRVAVDRNARRIVPCHDMQPYEAFPSTETFTGLRVAEARLAASERSRGP